MLDDLSRTRAFTRALHQVVQPGDVVIDIGTGTGALAVEAARAGAARVYAIEELAIADAAVQIFVANGVADRVSLVRGRSTRIELPERAHVLVSEILGNDPLAEDIIPIFRDARTRLLLPGARFVPRSVDIVALPVDLPDEFLAANTFTDGNTARWRTALDIDFRSLTGFSAQVVNLPDVKPQAIRHWSVVGEPLLLVRVDLATIDEVPVSASTFIARGSAKNLGFVLCFEAELASGVVISTLPSAVPDDNCWTCRVFRASTRPRVAPGDAIQVRFSGETGVSVIHSA